MRTSLDFFMLALESGDALTLQHVKWRDHNPSSNARSLRDWIWPCLP